MVLVEEWGLFGQPLGSVYLDKFTSTINYINLTATKWDLIRNYIKRKIYKAHRDTDNYLESQIDSVSPACTFLYKL